MLGLFILICVIAFGCFVWNGLSTFWWELTTPEGKAAAAERVRKNEYFRRLEEFKKLHPNDWWNMNTDHLNVNRFSPY